MNHKRGRMRHDGDTVMSVSFFRALFGAVLSILAIVSSPARAAAVEPKVDLDLVILVDESASLSKTDVMKEISAVASLVSRRELAGGSLRTRVAIAGFGSGENAVDEKCSLIEVTIDNIRTFQECADRITRRISGQHTDFAKALAYASTVFRASENPQARRGVILLTDGKFDPSGNRSTAGLTDSENDALEIALESLRTDGAQIWPLGFGKVSEEELDELAKNGAPSQCTSGIPPYAVIANDQPLDSHLLTILGALTCTKVGGPEPTPYDFPVHPFVNQVTLTVRGADGEPIVTVRNNNTSLCSGEWKRAIDESLSCTVTVTGDDVGIWRITADSSSSEKVATVETSQEGRVDLRLTECSRDEVRVAISRIDNTKIQWDVNRDFDFPRAQLSDATNQRLLQTFELTASQMTLQLDSKMAIETVDVSLAPNQDEFVWLTASKDQCQLPAIPEATTDKSPENSTGTDLPPEQSLDEDGFPLIQAILAALILALITWLVLKRLRPKFPADTELRQRNIANNPAATWNTRSNLDDLREAAFTVDKNGWLTEADGADADLIVRRIRNRQRGDFLLIEPAKSDSDSAGSATRENAHAFSTPDDKKFPGIRFRNTFIRIDVPEEPEDDDQQ